MKKEKTIADPQIIFALFEECLNKAEKKKLFKSADNLIDVQLPKLVDELKNSAYIKKVNYLISKDSFIQSGYYSVNNPEKRERNKNKQWDIHFLNALGFYSRNKPYNEVWELIKPEISGKLLKKSISHNNKHFFESVKNKLFNLLSSQNTDYKSPTDFIADKFKMHSSYLSKIIATEPSLLYNIIDGRSERLQLCNEFTNENVFELAEGFLLCHALSLHTDSIYLLAEIGRFLRLCNVFNKDNRQVFLTDKDFAKLNWVVQNYSSGKNDAQPSLTEDQIDDNLAKNKRFRMKLYGSLNLPVVECSFDNANKENKYFPDLDEDDIRSKANDYHILCKYFFRNHDFIETKLNEATTIKFLQILEDFINSQPNQHDVEILKTKVVKLALQPQIEVIKRVVESFKSCSEKTFQYFLLQYYHQYRFDKYLKIAISREISFDNVFRDLKRNDNKLGYDLYGAYFDDYYCYLKNGSEATVHAYYFPSGTLYSKLNKKLEGAERHIILLGDKYEKIAEVLKNYNKPNTISILICDLLSFAHFFFKWDEGKKLKSNFVLNFEKLLEGYDPDFYDSWMCYTKSKNDFENNIKNFETRLMTYWENITVLPYWYYPYLLTSTKTDVPKLINFYTDFINLLLRSLEKELEIGTDVFLPRIN